MKAFTKIGLMLVLVIVSCTLLLADTGWYVTQENNVKGLVIPAYMDDNQSLVLLNGARIDLTNNEFFKGKDSFAFETITDNSTNWRIIMLGNRINREEFVNSLITSINSEQKIKRGLAKVNIILSPEKFSSSSLNYGIKLAIVPNEKRVGRSEKTTEKTETGSLTTTTVSSGEATVLVK